MKKVFLAVLFLCGMAFGQFDPNTLIYGNAWQASGGLQNLQIGGANARQPAVKFVANNSAALASAGIYVKTGIGYSLGTGGSIRMSVQPDNGSGSPSGTILDSVTFSPGNPASPTFPVPALPSGYHPVVGLTYYFVFTNMDADPVNNYVSLDNMGMDTNTAPPFYSGNPIQINCALTSCYSQFAVLRKDGAGAWTLLTNQTPIISINYASGSSQGQGYVDELVSSGLFTVQGTNQAAEIFTPANDTIVSEMNIWAKKTGAPGVMTVSLQTAAGTVIETGTIPAASFGTNYSYAPYVFTSNKTLTALTQYRAILSSAADASNNYQVFPMQKGGACCGFNIPSVFNTGNYQTNTGGGWTNYTGSTAYDMPFFFNVAAPPIPPLSAGIINPLRVIDWSLVGVPGGIPTDYTQCGSTLPAGTTASVISSTTNACPARTYVRLGAGTFNLTSAIKVTSSLHAVKGLGADQTLLVFGSGAGCGLGGQSGSICAVDTLAIYNGNPQVLPPSGIRQMSWTAGYSQGSTAITLNSCGVGCVPPVVGQMIILDQADDTTDNGGMFICSSSTCNAEGGTNAVGRTIGGNRYSQQQIVKVTAISGTSTGPYFATITPGLYAPNWGKAGGNPGAWWSNNVQGIGFEDLSADYTANTSTGFGITLYDCLGCWVKGVRGLRPSGQAHVLSYQSAHTTIQDSYFYGSPGAEQSYGTEFFETCDVLVQNSIFQQVASPSAPGNYCGTVFAYNFSIYNKFSNNNWMQVTYSAHNTAGSYNLYESNNLNGCFNDNDWGTAPLNTFFRNYCVGAENVSSLQRTQDTMAMRFDFGSRGFNIVGNVLGLSPFLTVYETSSAVNAGSTTNCWKSVFTLGYRNVGSCSGMGSGPNDPLVRSTLMRWGNWDNIHGATQWDATESAPAAAGSGATQLAGNTMPASQVLPPSFYLNSRPSFMGSIPWPAIGPDVSGGNITGTGGHANQIPSRVCYFSLSGATADGTAGPATFNANTCYQSVSPTGPPGAPSVFVISANNQRSTIQ